ncbi:MAG: LodA/GoxA family CTQ-dependent oxidase, partial [Bacteroidota bacterium]
LDLSVQTDNLNLSPNFFDNRIAPGIDATYRNPNVLDQSLREPHAPNYRKELVNSPAPVSVSEGHARAEIVGSFPFSHARHNGKGISLLAKVMDTTDQTLPLGTLEYDNGTLIFYGADGTSASLNPSDLNTDFADNSNWYDDICDGRITAVITDKASGESFTLEDAESAAWVATTPPDYAPQIQPISTMYDLINGADKDAQYTEDFSLIFPVFYRLYRMQWVNLGDFLSPSFRETIDQMIANGTFKYLYTNDGSNEAAEVRRMIFQLFRNPLYDYNNEPVIPSKEDTDLSQLRSGTTSLKLPTYPGDGINYPGSPAQWFAIPPVLYRQLERWKDGE